MSSSAQFSPYRRELGRPPVLCTKRINQANRVCKYFVKEFELKVRSALYRHVAPPGLILGGRRHFYRHVAPLGLDIIRCKLRTR